MDTTTTRATPIYGMIYDFFRRILSWLNPGLPWVETFVYGSSLPYNLFILSSFFESLFCIRVVGTRARQLVLCI